MLAPKRPQNYWFSLLNHRLKLTARNKPVTNSCMMKAAAMTTSCMKFLFPFSEDPSCHGSHILLKHMDQERLTFLASFHLFIWDCKRSVDGITTEIFKANSPLQSNSTGPIFSAAHAHTTPVMEQILHIMNKCITEPFHKLRCRIG